jgi:hypothetical protein
LETKMESALRPRDIQARIRAGESPEMVAEAAQTTVDRIMGYATPVLAERAHIADRAQSASVRRKTSDGPSRLLGDTVAERLRSRNLDPESVEWDAWRRDDGRWMLVADYRSGEHPRQAQFIFDAPGRYVLAVDDEAKWLVGEPSSSHGPQPRVSTGGRRLGAVGHELPPELLDVQLPLGEDAIGMVTAEETSSLAGEEETEDLTVTAHAVRRVEPPQDLTAETGDADWMATQASDRPFAPVDRVAEPAAEPVTEPEAEAEPDADETDETDETGVDERTADDEPAGETDDEEAPARPARRPVKKNRGRASVPSWDEIMFGGPNE